jgi:hypothetical protein
MAEEILEIPEVRVVGKPVEKDMADAAIKLFQSYITTNEKAKKGEHITADDFNRAETEYNKVMKPINDSLKNLPKESADEIKNKAGHLIEKWLDENAPAMKDVRNLGALNEIFHKDYLKDSPAKNLSIAPNTNTPKELLLDILSKNNGIAVGDYHNSSTSYPLVSENMAALKKSGVDTIYFDANDVGFSKLNNMSTNELKDELAKRTPEFIKEEAEKNAAGSYRNKTPLDNYGDQLRLFLSAKENGIRLVNIDKEDPARGFESSRALGDHRVGSTNYTWTEKILDDRQNMPSGGKYIILGGAGHFGSIGATGRGYVDERLGIPFIAFDDRDKNDKSPILKGHHKDGADFYLPGGECHPDIKRTAEAANYENLAKRLKKHPEDYEKILGTLKKDLSEDEKHKLMLESKDLNAGRLASQLEFRAEIMRFNVDIHQLGNGCIVHVSEADNKTPLNTPPAPPQPSQPQR